MSDAEKPGVSIPFGKLPEGADVALLKQIRPIDLISVSQCSRKMKESVQSLELTAEYLEFHLTNNNCSVLKLSMNGQSVDVVCMLYKNLPQENWVMNENPMKTEKFTWTSHRTKTLWMAEERIFNGETFEINNGENHMNILWIQQKEGCLKTVSDYLIDLFHPKIITLRLTIEEYPEWRSCCVWEHGSQLTKIIISCGDRPQMITHEEFRFLLRQGSKNKMISFWMVYPKPQFVFHGILPLKLLSFCGPVPWVRLSNLMTPLLEVVSLYGCQFAADELRSVINTFISGFWPKLKYIDFLLPEGVTKAKLEKRVLRGWKRLPPDENRRSRYFGHRSSIHRYDCSGFLDIQSKNGLLASIGVDDEKFVMVVWHDRFPFGKPDSVSTEQ